jgi:hypothetical protein
MRIQFYINGPYRNGTVHVEIYEVKTHFIYLVKPE